MDFEILNPRLETILKREFELNHQNIQISGSDSLLLLALVLSKSSPSSFKSLPHLVVVPRFVDAQRLARCIGFFDDTIDPIILPHFDVSPYSSLSPKKSFISDRVRFLHKAKNPRPGQIFITPVGGLLQKTLPFDVLNKHSHEWSVGSSIPENVAEFLSRLGYESSPLVEDVGQFSVRGGILDLFSPGTTSPVRIELFGDEIVSIRQFQPDTQRSDSEIKSFFLLPAREVFWEADQEFLLESFVKSTKNREVNKSDFEDVLRSLTKQQIFPGIDFLIPFFYKKLASPLEHFSEPLNLWLINPPDILTHSDQIKAEMSHEFSTALENVIRPDFSQIYSSFEELPFPPDGNQIELFPIEVSDLTDQKKEIKKIAFSTSTPIELASLLTGKVVGSPVWTDAVKSKISQWQSDDYKIFVSAKNKTQADRLLLLFNKAELPAVFSNESSSVNLDSKIITIVIKPAPESLRSSEDRLIILRDEDFFGKKDRQNTSASRAAPKEFQDKARSLSFGDLKPGDYIVHTLHGLGKYEGLSVMSIGGAESEFIQVSYKDKDRLYLPVYRLNQIQKYSGLSENIALDKLGGTGWEKAKSKVKAAVKDLANELLKIYAERAQFHRPAFEVNHSDFLAFESSFQYEETPDQLRAIGEICKDLESTRPMDRLICGDVGFGKTEVAMRAAFVAAQNKKQVAVLAPTTVLTFQHLETFKKRFKGFNFKIEALNRFVTDAEAKKILARLKSGEVDIIIGTHRLLSRDVEFKNLGLLIIDEEQKFGVAHKERVRKLSVGVDTLAMSATPIPRTLNLSLAGIRDLSLINTAPSDRLPTRTFITKWDNEAIRKCIQTEISRSGQVYLIHNRIQSIFDVANRVRELLPEARISVAHGQMEESQLEETMIRFFNHEIDVLICTAIVESGMDVPRANTMIIDQAHMMGLSQLYQLRGRVGRSKERAYCYLILPPHKQLDKTAQERLKVIQENSALGSGIRIAQYDLELRGAGEILGESQSGHISTVGYELYMDLLRDAVEEQQGKAPAYKVDPEINLRIPALIPESYISDVRIRLSYYKTLSDITSQEEIDRVADELKDQFGEIPESTINLMGLMLIRSVGRTLAIKDISAGLKNVSLAFTEHTPLKTDTIIKLAMRENKKYSISPDARMSIRMNSITWPAVLDELNYLTTLI